eukprot:gnl/MRDRNA2_/MRDRNA2_90883_c0_seq1.p1 gnl/MRDRNA2_/MRDRNA2_90883_c0~~gnl/MRDRNA2_/MRDRNA2_90883_c0_seq1.p1  ORF type:complete len:109 (+),score=20.89 gnl/MRDRNA2_/MRDRNA2_90883_c0_seq1:89-415(+)
MMRVTVLLACMLIGFSTCDDTPGQAAGQHASLLQTGFVRTKNAVGTKSSKVHHEAGIEERELRDRIALLEATAAEQSVRIGNLHNVIKKLPGVGTNGKPEPCTCTSAK